MTQDTDTDGSRLSSNMLKQVGYDKVEVGQTVVLTMMMDLTDTLALYVVEVTRVDDDSISGRYRVLNHCTLDDYLSVNFEGAFRRINIISCVVCI
jgi:hypothetical protein